MNLFLLAALLVAQPHDPVESVQVSSSISAPTAIMPMIDLYSECTTRAFNEGNQRARPRDAAGVRDILDRGKVECADVRRRARTEAIRLIASDSSIARGDREEVVDAALAAVDRVGDVLVAGLEQAEAADSRGGNRQAAPNVRREWPEAPPRQDAPQGQARDGFVLTYRDEPHPNPLPFPAPIANFLGQYGNCISASLGRLPPSYPNPPVATGGDCGPFRERAFRNADLALQRATRLGARERSELIEANLQNVEAFINQRPIPHPDAHRLPDPRSSND